MHQAGQEMDSWGEWTIMCLVMLFMEDVEDIYIIGLIIIKFLMFGAGGFLVHHKFQNLLVAISKLVYLNEGKCCAVNTDALHKQNHKLDALTWKLAVVLELVCGVDNNLQKFSALLGGNWPPSPPFELAIETTERLKGRRNKLIADMHIADIHTIITDMLLDLTSPYPP